MFARAFGKGSDLSVESVAAAISPNDKPTSAAQLAKWLSSVGLTPSVSSTRLPYPYIALVEYKLLPKQNRSDPNASFKHWIIRLSDITYHDPYHYNQAGAFLLAEKRELDVAEIGSYITLKEFLEMSGAFVREPYDKKYLIAWRGDGRWPDYPPSSDHHMAMLEAYRRDNRYTLGDSFDDAGLDIVAKDGRRGKVFVELWGWPKDEKVRQEYVDFFKNNYPHAVVDFKEFEELEKAARPPVFEIGATPSVVERGGEVKVWWRVENVLDAYFGIQDKTGGFVWEPVNQQHGFKLYRPTESMRFALKIKSMRGVELTRYAQVEIAPERPKAPICEISVSADSVEAGKPVTVFWHVENVAAAYLNDKGITGPKGQASFVLSKDTVFSLKAVTRSGVVIVRTASVRVVQSPRPAQVKPAQRLLGWNVIDRHAKAEEAYAAGCRAFLWLEGHRGAAEFKAKYPDAIVIYRSWIEHGVKFANGAELVRKIGDIAPGLLYVGYNEADQWKQSGDDLKRRLEQDVEAARIVKDRGGFWLAGSFSHGTPDFTNPSVCETIKAIAAPAYNSGLMGFDMHLYSPNMDHIYKPGELIWFERRWEFLFTRCGFDPNVRAIYCTETGVDQGGVGGFPAHNAKDHDVEKWAREWVKISQAPLVVGDKSYPSPLVAACLFQAGNNENWAGYEISRYIGVWKKLWNE